MATNEFLQFSNDVSALTYTNAEYLAHTQRPIGNQIGIADPKLVNKSIRQSSTMSAVLAQYVSDMTGSDSIDDGTTTTLLANLKTATSVAYNSHFSTSKAIPVDSDELPIVDSSSSFSLKKLTWANLKTALSGIFATVNYVDVLVGGTQNAVSSLTSNGYQKLPSGLIMQWGYQARGTAVDVTVTLPVAFPNACLHISQNKANTTSGTPLGMNYYAVSSVNTTSFVFKRLTDVDVYWFAIGY